MISNYFRSVISLCLVFLQQSESCFAQSQNSTVSGSLHGDTIHRAQALQRVLDTYKERRKLVEETWSRLDTAELPCALPQKCGSKVKGGVYSGNVAQTIDKDDERLFVHQEVPVYVSCQVLVSQKYEFMYIRQPKSASTAVERAIKRDICQGTACTEEEFFLLDKLNVTDAQRDEWWMKFYVFSFVRNPWTRLSSAYFMFTEWVLHRKLDDKSVGPVCGLNFTSFSENSYRLRDICESERCCAYVANFNLGWLPRFTDLHIMDQSHCVVDQEGRWMVDFVGSAENLEADWASVIMEINRRSGRNATVGALPAANTRLAHTGAGQKPIEKKACNMTNYPHLTPAAIQNIAFQYAMDATNFGYLVVAS